MIRRLLKWLGWVVGSIVVSAAGSLVVDSVGHERVFTSAGRMILGAGSFLGQVLPMPVWLLGIVSFMILSAGIVFIGEAATRALKFASGPPAPWDEILAKMVEQNRRALQDREVRLGEKDTAIARQEESIRDLKAALVRAGKVAKGGDAAAREALAEARRSGDAGRLQAVLVGEADKLGDKAKELMGDYWQLCREIAAVAFLRGDIEEAEKRIGIILKAAPDDLEAINRMGHIHMLRGRLEDAEKTYKRVLELAATQEGRAAAYGNLGLVYKTRGDLDGAEKMHRKALEINEKLGRLAGMASHYGNLGLVYRRRGDLDRAEQMHRKSLEIDEKLGRLAGMASHYGNLGLVYQTRGDLDEAERFYRKSLEISEKLGLPELTANQYGNLGLVYKRRGDLDKAEQMHRKALEIDEKLGRLEGMANQYSNLGSVYQTRGDLGQARELSGKAVKLYQRIEMPHMAQKVQGWIDVLDQEGGRDRE